MRKRFTSLVFVVKKNSLCSILSLLLLIIIFWPKSQPSSNESELLFTLQATEQWFPDGLVGDNITGYKTLIVPNIVHYVMLDTNELMFVHFISVKSVLRHQKPEQIIFHCNCDQLIGNYWNLIVTESNSTKTILRLRTIVKPESVFGIRFSREYHNFHASDIIRNKVLMEFGGIYLDRDVYVVKSLDPLRKYEMVLDFEVYKQCLGTQIQIAHKRARFLRLYLLTYQQYIPDNWYWNAGEYPTQVIVNKFPHLVHRVNYSFGVTGSVMCPILYQSNTFDWKYNYYAIHLLIRGNTMGHSWCLNKRKPAETYFDEKTIKKSKVTFGQMARLVLHNTTDIIND